MQGADMRGAYMQGADMLGAYMQGAYMQGADMRGAYMQGADMRGAYMQGAYMQGAYMRGAYMQGAYMQGADMRGAYMRGAKIKDGLELVANSPMLQCGPAGSRQDYLIIFNTKVGLYVKAGCFLDTLTKFVSAVREKHKGTVYEKEYLNIVKMAKEHFKIHAKD
jgi:hypothetical protein